MFRIILMCLLTCCSSFMPLKQSESNICEEHTQFVERKTRENYVRTPSGYYEYGLTDLFSYDFLVGLLDYYVDDLGVSDMSPSNNNSVNDYVIQTSGVYSVFRYRWPQQEYALTYNVSNIVMKKAIFNGNLGSGWPLCVYDFKLANSSPYNYVFQISFFAQRTNDNRLTIWGCNIVPSNDLLHYLTIDEWYTRFMLSEKIDSFNSFIGNIFQTLRSDEQQIAYNQGYSDGYNIGYGNGESTGYQNGYNAGETAGYQNGFQQGVDDTIASGTEAMTIFSGIMDVAFIPVNVFFLMFNYDVFGINIAGLVSALLTIAVVLIIFRFIAGRKV